MVGDYQRVALLTYPHCVNCKWWTGKKSYDKFIILVFIGRIWSETFEIVVFVVILLFICAGQFVFLPATLLFRVLSDRLVKLRLECLFVRHHHLQWFVHFVHWFAIYVFLYCPQFFIKHLERYAYPRCPTAIIHDNPDDKQDKANGHHEETEERILYQRRHFVILLASCP